MEGDDHASSEAGNYESLTMRQILNIAKVNTKQDIWDKGGHLGFTIIPPNLDPDSVRRALVRCIKIRAAETERAIPLAEKKERDDAKNLGQTITDLRHRLAKLEKQYASVGSESHRLRRLLRKADLATGMLIEWNVYLALTNMTTAAVQFHAKTEMPITKNPSSAGEKRNLVCRCNGLGFRPRIYNLRLFFGTKHG